MNKIIFMNGSPNKDGNTNRIGEELLKNVDHDVLQMSDYKISQYENIYADDQIDEIFRRLEDKDTIVIDSPVYWYTVGGITKYDLSGKTVIPFATNAGWLGSTFKEIKELCKGNVEDEKSIKFYNRSFRK